ncbi:MAG: hypothetical protein PHI31_11285 [Desulfuromonadaceae bacterium]|nr:hypothetical protein [Desulfuromonadaceae bacterium]
MEKRIVASGIAALLLGLYSPVMSAMYSIENPADKIYNPAGKMRNPASDIKNPADTIHNPAAHMDNPNPLSPVTPQVVHQPDIKEATTSDTAELIKAPLHPHLKIALPRKNYHFKTEKAYLAAAKNAFIRDNYREFVSITEDALRRIDAGTLRASSKTKRTLDKYRKYGYGMLEKGDD